MNDDDIDESLIGTPSPEWWAEALKDPRFKAFVDSWPKDEHKAISPDQWSKMGIKLKRKEMINRTIFVTFQKEGIHRYPDAPAGVEFLKHPHRHMFHFKVTVEVFHDDRDIEFILFKRELEGLYTAGTMHIDHKSCEMLAQDLIDYISEKYVGRDIAVEVSEDGENGATLTFLKDRSGAVMD